MAAKNLLRSLGPCSLSKPRQRGDNYQSLEDHFLKLPPLAHYTQRTYIFYSNFAVPFKLYLIKASHFCQLPHALLTIKDGTSLLPTSSFSRHYSAQNCLKHSSAQFTKLFRLQIKVVNKFSSAVDSCHQINNQDVFFF